MFADTAPGVDMETCTALTWKHLNGGCTLEYVSLVEFMCLAFTRMPGESYRRRLRSLLLYLCYIFWVIINSLLCWQKHLVNGLLSTKHCNCPEWLSAVERMLTIQWLSERTLKTQWLSDRMLKIQWLTIWQDIKNLMTNLQEVNNPTTNYPNTCLSGTLSFCVCNTSTISAFKSNKCCCFEHPVNCQSSGWNVES